MKEENKRISLKENLIKAKQQRSLKQTQHIQFSSAYQTQEQGGTSDEITKKFQSYIQNFDQTLQKVNLNQLEQLKKKYRFYLSKVQKLQQIKNTLQQKFDTIQECIENSGPVQDQKQSIRFIQMISNQTEKKLIDIIQKVNQAKQVKKDYNKQKIKLKQILKREKDLFFSLKRSQTKLKQDTQALQKASKLDNAHNTFKNILNNKINKRREKNQISSQLNDTQRLMQISSRQSNYSIIKKQLYQKQLKRQENKLPQIVQSQIKDSNKNGEITENQRRKSCFTNTSVHKQQNKQSNKIQKNLMSQSVAFSSFKNQFDKNIGQKMAQSVKLKNIINKGKNKIMINHLTKINQMKEQLLKATQKVQKQSLISIQKKYQSFNNIYNQNDFGAKTKGSSHYKIKAQTQSNAQLAYRQQKQLQNSRQKRLKNCNACQVNHQRYRISILKYSLHQNQAQHLKNKLGCNKKQPQMLLNVNQLQKLRGIQTLRQNFLQLKPQQIIRQIVKKGKIQQTIKLFQKQKIIQPKDKLKIKILR